MASKTKWFVLLCAYVSYILFGASVFYTVESKEEEKRTQVEQTQRRAIEELLKNHYLPNDEHSLDDLFGKITDYCEKPLGDNVDQEAKLSWSFYHAVFFVLTAVSTIGYGDLSPSTPFTRTFMILYGLIGIPITGVLIIQLGKFFGTSFLKLYRPWKTTHAQHPLATIGIIGQITLYSILGMTLFVLIPSGVITWYEDWSFLLALEFALEALTTVGVGDNVPAADPNNFSYVVFMLYRMFLLIWIIMGLGYLAMVFNLISRGLQSKQIKAIKQRLTNNIKKTNRRIRRELRAVLNEYLLMRVKPVYRDQRFVKCERTQSCPDLRFIDKDLESPKTKKRALSELTKPTVKALSRIHSDTDLECIDKERTFVPETDINDSNHFLLRVANALGHYDSTCSLPSTRENQFSSEIKIAGNDDDFDDDNFDIDWSYNHPKLSKLSLDSKQDRSAINFNLSFHESNSRLNQETREKEKYGKARSRTLPPIHKNQNFFTRMKNTFKHHDDKKPKTVDLESHHHHPSDRLKERSGSVFSATETDHLLEETSIADFLRALTAIDVSELSTPRFKNVVVKATKTRRTAIPPVLQSRKISLIPSSPSQDSKHRRFSLSPKTSVDNRSYLPHSVFAPISEVDDESTKKNGTRQRKSIHYHVAPRPRLKGPLPKNIR